MAAGTESKIDTRLFAATAESVSKVAKDLDSCFSDWARIMSGLRSNWQGDTSDDIKNTTEAVQNSAAVLLAALGGYRTTLNELAGIYDRTEANVKETGKSLKFDRPMR